MRNEYTIKPVASYLLSIQMSTSLAENGGKRDRAVIVTIKQSEFHALLNFVRTVGTVRRAVRVFFSLARSLFLCFSNWAALTIWAVNHVKIKKLRRLINRRSSFALSERGTRRPQMSAGRAANWRKITINSNWRKLYSITEKTEMKKEKADLRD